MAAVAQPQRPTRIRYVVVASASLMAVLLYLDRFCISFAEVYIQEDLGLTNTQVGWMLSAFFWTYALGQVPAGWLSDRFGSRLMLTLYVLSWSLLTTLTGLATGFVMLLALRIGFGFAQAGAYPTASGIVSRWIPFAERGRASSLIALGGQLGGFLALLASGFLLVALTPLSTPTRIAADDILNGPLICHQLQTAADPVDPVDRARQKVLRQFSSAGRRLIEQQAELYAAVLATAESRRDEDGGSRRGAGVEVPPLSADERQTLASEFNAIIAAPGFFTREDTAGLSVEKETRRLLTRSGELSDRQSERANRLVLEGLHREGLRKLYGAGWRPLMFFYGSLGIFVAGLIWWNCRTDPAEHPQINAAERKLITGLSVTRPTPRLSRIPLRELVTSGSMWCSCLSQWFTNVGWVFLMTWAPRYYSSVHELPIEKRALLVSIPPLFGWAGMLVGGAVTDRASSSLGLRWGRALPISLSRFLAMAAYIGCLFEPGPYVAAALFSVVAFATSLGTAPGWAFTQDVGGRHVGSVLGWGNMWGNLGAAVTPPFLIAIVGEAENWNNAFIVCAVAFFLSGIVALGINATVPIALEETQPDDEIPL
jgi:MFS transporter, ACS family, glucarate transporter